MRIRYENSFEDFVALQRDVEKHALYPRFNVRNFVSFCALLWAAFTVFLVSRGILYPRLAILLGLVWALVTVGAGWAAQWLFEFGIYGVLRVLYGWNIVKVVLGEHALEIAEDRLVERCEGGGSSFDWQSIERIHIDRDYAFIYVSSLQGHVIPRGQVIEGDFDAFAAEVQRRIEGPSCA